ncbi:anti-sigma factor domain-containing protein [Halobacillus sp. Marseille-Q1614]|uniref:anti-sigma-I factor RsgI family protein n=1 Tax=Halobacillus sp. Marseille-Q1614 TaxID=2709134 RepID=UPI00156DB9BE|nr:anti-sigma factor domain-containing protein [Halobacillus sp. Marseille-Q1614]
MRKGIVLEQTKKFTIVMADDGSFLKAKRLKNADIGMEVHFQAYEPGSSIGKFMLIHRMKIAAVTIALLLTLFPVYLWHEGNKTYALVNVDINPSVELKVNEKMKVLAINPLNEDAKEMIASLEDWKMSPASEVALQMINFSREEGFLNSDHQVLIGVSYLEGDSELNFSDQIENYIGEKMQDLLLASYTVPEAVRLQAEEEGSSVNELMARKIKDEENQEEETQPASVSIEDDDKAIIQSFYNENESSKENDVEKVDIPDESSSKLEETPVVPIPAQPKKSPHNGQADEKKNKESHKHRSEVLKEKDKQPPSHASSHANGKPLKDKNDHRNEKASDKDNPSLPKNAPPEKKKPNKEKHKDHPSNNGHKNDKDNKGNDKGSYDGRANKGNKDYKAKPNNNKHEKHPHK